MAYETKEKQGALFENTDKKQDNSPDYTGTFKLDGKMWRIAGWARRSSGDKLYLSLAISEPQQQSSNVGANDPGFQAMRERMKAAGEAARQRFEDSGPRSRDLGDDFADDDIPF